MFDTIGLPELLVLILVSGAAATVWRSANRKSPPPSVAKSQVMRDRLKATSGPQQASAVSKDGSQRERQLSARDLDAARMPSTTKAALPIPFGDYSDIPRYLDYLRSHAPLAVVTESKRWAVPSNYLCEMADAVMVLLNANVGPDVTAEHARQLYAEGLRRAEEEEQSGANSKGGHWGSYAMLGKLLADAGEHAEAVRAFEKSVAKGAADPQVTLHLANSLALSGRSWESLALIRTTPALSPEQKAEVFRVVSEVVALDGRNPRG